MASRTRARINNLNDRAREVGAAGVLTLEDIDALKAFYDFTCLKCGARPAISPDHVKPLALGGSNTVDNLQLLCETCNKGKGDLEQDYRGGKVLTPDLVPQFSKSTDSTTKTNRKYEWSAIENEYITADPFISTRSLADKHNIPYPTLRDYALRHDWDSQRRDTRSTLVATAHFEAQEQVKQGLVQRELNARATLFQLIDAAVEEWQNKPRATLGDLAQLLKLGLAAQHVPTEHTVIEDDNDFVDDDIVEAAERVARRANRTAEDSDTERGAPDEDGSGAGWTD